MSVTRCTGPIGRREFLQVGSLAIGGLTLADVLAARSAQAAAGSAATEATSPPDTSVILLYLHGGPSQLETYDLKLDAPSTYRSVFNSIPTVVPGMDICELLPRHAEVADRFSLVRSLHHDISIHSDGGIIVLTGKRPSKLDPTSQSKSEHPDFGSVASRVRGIGARGIPPYIAIPSRLYMTRPTYLGAHHAAFELGNPANENGSGFAPPRMYLPAGRDAKSFDDRRALLNSIDRLRRDLDQNENLAATESFRGQAFQMLTSPQAAEAYDLSKENDKLRDRYGRHLWGQGCLLSRRLAEAGAAVISLYVDSPQNSPDYTNWDDHIANAGRPGHFGDYMRRRLLFLDQALSALIEDIFTRGLDRKILVVVVGEFGRTPRLSHNNQGTGRDHWPQAYTALLSGGGLRMGQVVGATNSKAEFPTERPYTPQDLLATIYRHLGINTDQQFLDHSGRPISILQSGEPIPELV